MKRNQIRNHLKGIGTTNAKITYLNDILSRKGLIREETKKGINSELGTLYQRLGRNDLAIKSYQAAGDMEGLAPLYRPQLDKRRDSLLKELKLEDVFEITCLSEEYKMLGTPEDLEVAKNLKMEAAKMYFSRAVIEKKYLKEQVFDQIRERGFYEGFHCRNPRSSLSRASTYKKMIRSLNWAATLYGELGNETKKQEMHQKAEKEKSRFLRRFVKEALKDDPSYPSLSLYNDYCGDGISDEYAPGGEKDIEKLLEEEVARQKRNETN